MEAQGGDGYSAGVQNASAAASDQHPAIGIMPPHRFDLSETNAWLEHLDKKGFVVVSGILKEGTLEVTTADKNLEELRLLLWEHLEEATEGAWTQGDPASWKDDDVFRRCLGSSGPEIGLVSKRGTGQSDVLWRAREFVDRSGVFRKIWCKCDDESMLTSYDGLGLFRPWQHGIGRKTDQGWFHVDQGKLKREGRHCVQGLLTLYDQTEETGGFTVYCPTNESRSYANYVRVFEDLVDNYASSDVDTDFIKLPESHLLYKSLDSEERPFRLVTAQAGDLVLWDSRLLHCNEPARTTEAEAEDVKSKIASHRLLRAVLYICMTPKSFADEKVLKDRIQAYNIKASTSHWPHCNVMGFGWGRGKKLIYDDASEGRKKLIA